MRIQWGLFDVTAKDDAVLTSSPMLPFGSLADLQNDTTVQRKYVTLEEGQTILDGSFEPMPPNPPNMGYWSSIMSDENGLFPETQRPWLQADFPERDHSSIGVTLTFSEVYQDWPGETVFTWYDDQNSVITFGHFFPSRATYFFARNAENYRRIRIGFWGTDKPYRFIKVARIDYGSLNEIQSENVITATVSERLNPISAELWINSLALKFFSDSTDFSPLNPEGVYGFLQQRQQIDVQRIENDELSDMGSFYLDTWDDATDQTVSLSAIDLLGVINKTDFAGGMYVNIRADALIKEIMTSADAKYTLSASLSGILVSGYIPISTHLEALRQVCFAIGADADCSRGKTINIFPQTEEMTSIIGIDRKFGTTTALSELVTGIEMISHDYVKSTEEIELFNGELSIGTFDIVFSEPAHSVTTTGAVQSNVTVNAARVTVTAPGTVVIIGKKYLDNQMSTRQLVSRAASNSAPNVPKIEAATMINSKNAAQITSLVFDYYQNRYSLTFNMFPMGERVGDLVMVETVGGGRLRGWIEQLRHDLTGGGRAECTVVGKPVPIVIADYMGEIYMGEEIGLI